MEVNIDELVKAQIAQKIIESLPESERQKILEASITKTLQEVLKPWNVEKAISSDVNRYMSEYLQNPEVQNRIREATKKAVDELISGVIRVIISNSQRGIKSEYQEFMKLQGDKQ